MAKAKVNSHAKKITKFFENELIYFEIFIKMNYFYYIQPLTLSNIPKFSDYRKSFGIYLQLIITTSAS